MTARSLVQIVAGWHAGPLARVRLEEPMPMRSLSLAASPPSTSSRPPPAHLVCLKRHYPGNVPEPACKTMVAIKSGTVHMVAMGAAMGGAYGISIMSSSQMHLHTS